MADFRRTRSYVRSNVVLLPVIARRNLPGASRGAIGEDPGNVVELRRIREIRAFLRRCEELGREGKPCR